MCLLEGIPSLNQNAGLLPAQDIVRGTGETIGSGLALPYTLPPPFFPLDSNLVLLSASKPQTVLLSGNDLILSGAHET